MSLRRVCATRYVTPLREGGSLPGIVEADDDGLYVVKFRGAGQGTKALVADLLGGELARALGLPVPEMALVELNAELGLNEPDPEIRDLIVGSEGLNLGVDYLPGAFGYDPATARGITAELAARIVWFDAFLMNVDRTARNPNILLWHHEPWLIDHGAALYFHHRWEGYLERADSRFPQVRDHVLLRLAGDIHAAGEEMAAALSTVVIEQAVAMIPDDWLGDGSPFGSTAEEREAYGRWLLRRLELRAAFTEEAVHARGV